MRSLFLGFVVLLFSCATDDDAGVFPNIQGEWEWFRSCGGITGDCFGPSADNSVTLAFRSDLTFEERSNGMIERQGNFTISENMNAEGQVVFRIQFNQQPQQRFRIESDVLFLESGSIWREFRRVTN